MSETNTLPAERPAYAGVEMQATDGGGMLSPKNLGDIVGFAAVMARADIALPKHLRNNQGACLAVTMQALRWEMDPFMVANKTYSVNDRLAYEAQLVAAVVITRAPVRGRPVYTYSGEGPTRRCKVVLTMKDDQQLEYETPQFKDILTKNSPLWKADLDQQLGYFAIRSWARRHTPDVILGVYTPDEAAVMEEEPKSVGLSARLERDAPTGGFKQGVVDAALDAEFEVRDPETAAGMAEVAEKIAEREETAVEAAQEPEATTPPTEAEEGSSPQEEPQEPTFSLDSPINVGMPRDMLVAWAEAFKATCLKLKDPAELNGLWSTYFKSGHMTVLHETVPDKYTALEEWFVDRIRKQRAK